MSHMTRGNTNTPSSQVIGAPKELPVSDLGTNRDVLQQALYLRFQDLRHPRNYPKEEVVNDIVKHVKDNWKRINSKIGEYPVVVSDQEIARKITFLWNKVEEYTSKKGGTGKTTRKKGEQK